MSEYNIQMNKYNALNAGYDQLYPQPMKHANTHAKDGNDPITPSMIGTYTQTQIDTALQNKAPSGYGLGEVDAPYLADLHDKNAKNGWYRCSNAANAPVTGGANHVYGWAFITRGVYIKVDYYTSTTNPIHFICYCVDEVWTEWDCVNPPMLLGIEYRTTERYQGKPVYAKRIHCESMPSGAGYIDIQPSNTEVPNALISTAIVIRCYGRASAEATIPFYSSPNDFMQVGSVSNNVIRIYTAQSYGGTAEIAVYYTKTTD